MTRLSIKFKATLVATLFFLASLALVSMVQLSYVKAQMKQVLADQQFTLVSRVADEIDQKLAVNREALVANAKLVPVARLKDPAALEKGLAERVALRTLFSDLFIHSANGMVAKFAL
ncbi:MAG TPA: hypothetical protein VE085_02455 [Burkholderiales bacterium]|nr:hypothetical protein [Burkholderiales bacterium]